MTIELNTLAPKKWVANYSGSAPTIDITDGVRVGDLAIDTSNNAIWQCEDNTDTSAVWVKQNVDIPLSGSSAITGSLIPTDDDTIDLGDATHQWRDLYLSGSTLHFGGEPLTKSGDDLSWRSSLVWDSTNASIFNLFDVNATAPSTQNDEGQLLGTFYSPPTGYGDGSAGAIAPSGVYNVHTNDGAHTDLTLKASTGSSTITVTDTTGFVAGDLCLLHQIQIGGAQSGVEGFTVADAGKIEEVEILSVDGPSKTITFTGPITNTFTSEAGSASVDVSSRDGTTPNLEVGNNLDKTQIVKIVQYTDVNLLSGSLTGDAFDGLSGGLLAFTVSNEIWGSGNIDMNEKGFRSGFGIFDAGFSEGFSGEGYNGGTYWEVRDKSDNGGGTGAASHTAGGGCQTVGVTQSTGIGGGTYGGSDDEASTRAMFGGAGAAIWNVFDGITYLSGSGGGSVWCRFSNFTGTGYSGVVTANGGNGESTAGSGAGGSVLVCTPTTFPAVQMEVDGGTANSDGGIGYEHSCEPSSNAVSEIRYIGTVDDDINLGSMSASDDSIPTQLAVKTYADGVSGTVQGTDGTYDIEPSNDGETDGDTRGENSVDLCTKRSDAAYVCSGINSGSIAGENNGGTGTHSLYGAGSGNHTNSGNYCFISGNSADSNNLDYARVHGGSSNARVIDLVAKASTTNTTPTAITLGGAAEGADGSLIIPPDTAWAFTVHVVAVDVTNGFANSGKFSFDGLCLNDGGTVTVSSATLGTDTTQGTFTGSVAISADTTNDALRIMATGIGTDTIRWTARVELTHVD